AQPAGALAELPRPDGATLGGLVPPVVQQAPVVIPQTVGSKVFTPPSLPLGMLAFGQNIRLASSPQSVPGELDRQSGGNGLQQDREASSGSDASPSPAAPQPVEPSAGALPVAPLDLAADASEPAPTRAPAPGDALASAPAEAAESSDSATGSTLAAAAGVLAGAGRIQWTLPAADKAANRRASGRRAA
ncbi:MAG: hypothetical protein JNL99_07200, partial [Zoogloea sp.]|nr:hypothetical protein [Zoogloea sp.]